ncbi:MAG TPA: type II secretion system protein [Tepidisphaeraceae bacterium]|nr:type II secretion system protein [Tepidisphaeraceae bacterium]
MLHRRQRTTGFTLIEILIVVVLLGIMAAIVFPQFTNSSHQAKQAALAKIVQTVRTQIVLYKAQHGDQLPDLPNAASVNQHFRPLLRVTTYGNPPRDYGPYLLSLPVNPVTGGSRVRPATTFNAAGLPDPIPGADFIYDYGGGSGTGNLWGTLDRATGVPMPQ